MHLPPDEPVGPLLSFDAGRPPRRDVLRASALITVAALATNGVNVVFHFVTARLMGPEEYSLLTTMFAVFLVATVPLLALQATVARESSALIAEGDDADVGVVLRSSLRLVLRFAVTVVIVAAILFVPLVSVLNVERLLPVLAVIVAFFAQVPYPVGIGTLQATERFGMLAGANALQAALKLLTGVALAALGFGASAITFGFAGATVIVFALMLYVLRGYLAQGQGSSIPARQALLGGYAAGAALALGLNTVLVNTDLIWARGTLTPEEAGFYAAASVTTSALLLIPVGVATVLFPRVARLRRHERGQSDLTFGLAITAALGALGVGVLALIPTFILEVCFGGEYTEAAPWLAPLGIAMALYGLVIVYLNHMLALGRAAIAWVLVGAVVLQQGLFLLFRGSAENIIAVQIVVSVLLVIACEIFHRLDRSRS